MAIFRPVTSLSGPHWGGTQRFTAVRRPWGTQSTPYTSGNTEKRSSKLWLHLERRYRGRQQPTAGYRLDASLLREPRRLPNVDRHLK